ncbi:MAG: hypothetical protein GYA21_11400 [Myxococcales bacterium]|nr:hypothetical protein [Myxococcales bacterium]
MRKTSLILVSVIVAFNLAACGSDGGGGGPKACVGKCTQDSDCDANLKCLTSTGQCVACLQDSDCAKGCDATTHTCKQCTNDSECVVATVKIMTGQCDSFGRCLKCATSNDCDFAGSTLKICGPAGYCVKCAQDSDCTGIGHQCIDNVCVWKGDSCTTDAQCSYDFVCKGGYCSCTGDAMCEAAFGSSNDLHWTCVSM